MRKTTKAVAAGLTLISSMAVAAWALAEGAPKDDRTATTELMRTIVPPAAYEATLEQMYAQMSAAMEKMGKGAMPASQQKALRDAVKEILPYEDLIKWSTDVYLKHLTRKEIDDLAVFYRTPTGKKVAAKMPQIAGEVGAMMAPMLMTRTPAVLKKHGFQI
jgi:hypothetical protein